MQEEKRNWMLRRTCKRKTSVREIEIAGQEFPVHTRKEKITVLIECLQWGFSGPLGTNSEANMTGKHNIVKTANCQEADKWAVYNAPFRS